MSADKNYLGDSVYVDIEAHGIQVTTENGLGATNTIFFEPEVLNALDRYRLRMAEKYSAPHLKPKPE